MENNDDFQQAMEKKKETSQYDGMSLEDAFTTISKDARNLIGTKEEEMKIIATKVLKEQLEVKLKNVSEKPIDILKRIDKYVEYEKYIEEGTEMSAVAVRIIIFDEEIKLIQKEIIQKLEEEEERKRIENNPPDEEEEEEEDDDDDKVEEEVKVETLWEQFINKSEDMNKTQEEKDLLMTPWKSFNESFRISKHTEILQLKKITCDFWGIEDVTGWHLYDENGDK